MAVGVSELLDDEFVELLFLPVGDFSARLGELLFRVVRDYQGVECDLAGVDLLNSLDVVGEHFFGLIRKVEDHINVERVEHALNRGESLFYFFAGAVPFKPLNAFEDFIVKRLHADRKAINAGLFEDSKGV